MKNSIELIGVCGTGLDEKAQRIVEECKAAVASSRYMGIAQECGIRKIIPVAPVKEMLGNVERELQEGSVAVLASGDPLFFGIGRTLIERFGSDAVNIHPALSSMQLACAAFKIPWDDVKFISLHGRDIDRAASQILQNRITVILTDSRNSPDAVSAMLLERLEHIDALEMEHHIKVHVAENLGLPGQHLFTGSLRQTAAREFGPLNIIIVRVDAENDPFPRLGLKEDEIVHARALITKDEIRAAVLHALRLEPQGCLWDIGAGSGSVSIEAAGIYPELQIYSIENKPEQQEYIAENIRTFGRWNINLIKGSAPEALYGLPAPQRIFIGGSDGRLEAIIRECSERLTDGGRIVVNAVLEKTAIQAPFIMRACGLSVSWSRISVERSDSHGSLSRLNPITVITGIKP